MSQDDPRSDPPARPVPLCLDPATVDQLLGLDDGGTGLMEELFGLFQEDTPSRLANLRTHLRAGEGGVASELAHALKGSAGTMGATRMRTIAQQIEKSTKTGTVDPATAALMPELEAAYLEACEGLQSFLSA